MKTNQQTDLGLCLLMGDGVSGFRGVLVVQDGVTLGDLYGQFIMSAIIAKHIKLFLAILLVFIYLVDMDLRVGRILGRFEDRMSWKISLIP